MKSSSKANKASTKKEGDTSNSAAERVLKIMECLSENQAPVRLQVIAAELDMPQATVLRYLNILAEQNYVYQEEETLRYGLTFKVCRIGYQLTSNISVRNVARTFLSDLFQQLKMGVCLVKDYNNQGIYLDFLDNPSGEMYTLQRIGKQAPLHTTGSGKMLLSGYSEQKIDTIIDQVGLAKLTEYTISDKEELMKELELIRERGYSVDNEECELGVRCISVPIYDYTDHVTAAISVFTSAANYTEQEMVEHVLPSLKETARRISLRLGSLESGYE